MNKEELKALIDEKVKTNGKGEITALSLNEVLTAVAENAGGGVNVIKVRIPSEYDETTLFEPHTEQEEIDRIYDEIKEGIPCFISAQMGEDGIFAYQQSLSTSDLISTMLGMEFGVEGMKDITGLLPLSSQAVAIANFSLNVDEDESHIELQDKWIAYTSIL